jgi:hypothetical protein
VPPTGAPWQGPVIPLGEVDDARPRSRRRPSAGPPAGATWQPPAGATWEPPAGPAWEVPVAPQPPPGWVVEPIAARNRAGIWSRPPGLVNAALLLPVAVAVLWWGSFPGGRASGVVSVVFGIALVVGAGALVVWATRATTFVVQVIRRRNDPRRAWTIVLVPTVVLAALVTVGEEATVRLRWALSDDAFATVAAEVGAGPPGEWQPVDVPDRIGWIDVADAKTYGEVLFVRPSDPSWDTWLIHARTSLIIPNGYQHEGRLRSLGDGWWLWTDV